MPAPLPTPKQVALIQKLAREKDATGFVDAVDARTRSEASALIATLLRRPAASTPLPSLPVVNEAELQERVRQHISGLGEHRSYADPFPEKRGKERVSFTCDKCSGTGFLEHFRTDEADSCFACRGKGTYSTLVSSARARVRRQIASHNAQIDKQKEHAESYVRAIMEDEVRQRALQEMQEVTDLKLRESLEKMERDFPQGMELGPIPVTVTSVTTLPLPDPRQPHLEIPTRIITFTSDSGDQFAWFSTSKAAVETVKGRAGVLRGTVKKVHDYRGRAQAIISHARLLPA